MKGWWVRDRNGEEGREREGIKSMESRRSERIGEEGKGGREKGRVRE